MKQVSSYEQGITSGHTGLQFTLKSLLSKALIRVLNILASVLRSSHHLELVLRRCCVIKQVMVE